MSDTPTEKPDPTKDYEAYKRWRAAQKGGGGAAAATAEKPKAEGKPAGEAKAEASTGESAPDPNAWPPPDRPNPITHYQEYKTWKVKRKGASAGAAVAVSSDGGPPRKKAAPHAAKFKKKEPARRSVLLSLGGAMWAIQAGALGMFGALCLRFLFPNVLYEPPKTFKIGPPDIYLPNEVDNHLKGAKQIWVVRDDVKIFVLKAVCTHLGCTPNWLAAEGKFKCPCHGSGFRFTGMNFEGPAPRPLERFRVYLADDGQIVVDTTKVFLNEAQWSDPEASVPV